MTRRKYKPGAKFKTMGSLCHWLFELNRYIYWHRKVMHPGWAISMTTRTLHDAVRTGILRRAELTQQERKS